MTGKRKRYSADFKAKVALEALHGELTTAQLATKLGVHQTMVSEWKRQAVDGLASLFQSRRRPKRASGKEARQDRTIGGGAEFFAKDSGRSYCVSCCKPAASALIERGLIWTRRCFRFGWTGSGLGHATSAEKPS